MQETSVNMKNIPLLKIDLTNRARKKYTNLDHLVKDFQEKGIISPIAVQLRDTPAGEDDPFEYTLLAGGRRCAAAVLAKMETIPARIYPAEMSDLERREIELMENISREELHWTERVWLTEEIDKLKKEQFGEAIGPSEGHSSNDTAKLLGVSPMTVSRDKRLAEGLRRHGEVIADAKNASEALATLKKVERKEEAEESARAFNRELEEGNVDELKQKIINGYILDAFFERVKMVPDMAVSFIEIDPPYGMDLKNIKKVEHDLQLDVEDYHEIDEVEYSSFLTDLFFECERAMLPNSWMICWCAIQWYSEVIDCMKAAGLSPATVPGVWTKGNTTGQTNNPTRILGSSCEFFVYARKGDAILRDPGRSNRFDFKPIFADDKVHMAERPIEMMEELIALFTPPGGRIMVPFLGSGNTLLAAFNKGFSGFGYELNEDYQNSFIDRVRKGTIGKFTSYPRQTP